MPKMTAARAAQIFNRSEEEIRNYSIASAKLDFLKYNPAFSYQENYDAMMWLFRPSAITKDQIEDIISRSDPNFRCSSDSTRRSLSRQVADYRVKDLLTREKIIADDMAAHGGVDALSGSGTGNQNRLTFFLRTEGGKEADNFNERFLNAYRSGTPEQRGQVIYEEFNRLRKELDVMEPEELYSLMTLSDKQFIEKLPHIHHFLAILTESKEFGGAKLTEKQYEHISRFRDIGTGLQGIMHTRMAQISNPTYEFIGPETFRTRDLMPSMGASKNILEDEDFSAKGDGRAPDDQPIHQFLSDCYFIANMSGDMVREAVCAKDPRLNSATWSVEGSTPQELAGSISEDIKAFRPVVARLRTGEVKVVASPYDTEAKSLEQYLGALSAIADKSNRFLFTGSKQFDDMNTTMKNMLSMAKSGKGLSGAELENWMTLLQQRAQEYLEYKGYDKKNMDRVDGYDPVNLPESKNSREQSRIELAATLVKLTRAHAKVREKTKDMDKKLSEQTAAKKAAPKKVNKSATLVGVEGFLKNANSALHFVPKDRAKDAPFQLSGDTGAGLTEFGMLALFGVASPDTKYRTTTKKEGQEFEEHVNDPDKAYPEMLSNVIYRKHTNYNRTAIASASALLRKCKNNAIDAIVAADAGNFELMGKLIANGLKQNTKLMDSQKAINEDFIACSDINAKALDLMARNPELEKAVSNNMTKAELNAAKAAAAMGKVHLEGVKSLDKIAESNYILNANHEKDLINVFQMSYVDNQFASKTVSLEQSPYGSDPALPDKINGLLANNIDTTKILSSGSENIQALLNNRNKQSEACNDIILESQNKPESKKQAAPEKVVNKENEKEQDANVKSMT
ncbi:MAG: hypothetical protein IKV99_08550 [Oscillospiraceae bacterium]|nr:hypothetical protein [Oscillospiraceae bacterium]